MCEQLKETRGKIHTINAMKIDYVIRSLTQVSFKILNYFTRCFRYLIVFLINTILLDGGRSERYILT